MVTRSADSRNRVVTPRQSRAIRDSAYSAVWQAARRATFTAREFQSPLAHRTYDLRHAAMSLWLNSGVLPPKSPTAPGTSPLSCSRSRPTASTAMT